MKRANFNYTKVVLCVQRLGFTQNNSMKPHRRLKILIRFKNLSSKTLSDMKQMFPDSEIQAAKMKSARKDKMVVLLHLTQSINCDRLSQFVVRHKISKSNYMLWISLVTEQYSDGVLVPKFALNILARLNCGLNFSCTRI